MPIRPTDDAPAERAGERIAKLLARAGVASRREVERMIAEGRVALDGVALDTPATLLRSLHGVTVDGTPVAAAPPARLFAYHKPVGLLVTERDPAGRPTIYDRLPAGLPRVVPVGRLDLATEGLLLLTTDGGLKRQLELPATGVERTYRARAYGPVSQEQLEELIDGIEIEGVRYGPIDANLERRTGANTWIELTLTEGKNREVRRVLEHLGLEVSRLIRTRYGPFMLGDMPPGSVGEVRQHDLVAFRQSLKTGGKGGDREMRVMAQPLAAATAPAGGSPARENASVRRSTVATKNAAAPASSQGPRDAATRRGGSETRAASPRPFVPAKSEGRPAARASGKAAGASASSTRTEQRGSPARTPRQGQGVSPRDERRGAERPRAATSRTRPPRPGEGSDAAAPPSRAGRPARGIARRGEQDDRGARDERSGRAARDDRSARRAGAQDRPTADASRPRRPGARPDSPGSDRPAPGRPSGPRRPTGPRGKR